MFQNAFENMYIISCIYLCSNSLAFRCSSWHNDVDTDGQLNEQIDRRINGISEEYVNFIPHINEYRTNYE